MAGGVMHVQWYATVFRKDSFAQRVVEAAPLVLRYGATKYAVHQSLDDRYRITQMAWFDRKEDWYRYWDGPEMIEFRARYGTHFQVPIVYAWHEELATGELGPSVEAVQWPEPRPQEPQIPV